MPGGILIAGDTAAVAPAGARVLEVGCKAVGPLGQRRLHLGREQVQAKPHLATGSVLSVHTLEMGHAIGLPEGYRSWVAVVSQPAILGDQEAAVLHSGRVDQPVGRVAGK